MSEKKGKPRGRNGGRKPLDDPANVQVAFRLRASQVDRLCDMTGIDGRHLAAKHVTEMFLESEELDT